MNSIYQWKFDVWRLGYANPSTNQFVPYALVQQAGILSRASQISRRFGALAGTQYTLDQVQALADSLQAREREERFVPCPCCGGSGTFCVYLMKPVSCSICGGSGRRVRSEEAER